MLKLKRLGLAAALLAISSGAGMAGSSRPYINAGCVNWSNGPCAGGSNSDGSSWCCDNASCQGYADGGASYNGTGTCYSW